MEYSANLPFKDPDFPGQFLAFGYLFGKFEPNSEQSDSGLIQGPLHLKKSIQIPLVIPYRLWLNFNEKHQIKLNTAYLWRVYCRTNQEGTIHQVQAVRFIPLEGKTTLRHSPPSDSGADYFLIRGRIAFVDTEKVVVRIERNFIPPKGKEHKYHWKPFFITLWGQVSQETKVEVGQFWEFLGLRQDERLTIAQSHLITQEELEKEPPDPLFAQKFVKSSSKKRKSSKKNSAKQKIATNSPKITINKENKPHSSSKNELSLIMINGRTPEITVKFTERPDCPQQGKKVTLQVTDDKGITVKAEINRKTLKKQVDKMDSFADWVAALSGKIAGISAEGVIELESAGLTVFERKPKEEKKKSEISVKSENDSPNKTSESENLQYSAKNKANSPSNPQKSSPDEPSKKVIRLV